MQGVIWLLRQKGALSLRKRSIWWNAAVNLAYIIVIFLAIAMLSNLIGNVSLARLMAVGIFGSVNVALVIYSLVLVLEGLVTLLLRSKPAMSLFMVKKYPELIEKNIVRYIQIAALLSWLVYTLSLYESLDPLLNWGGEILTKKWTIGTEGVTFSLLGIALFFLYLWLSFMLAKFLKFILEEEILIRMKLPRGVPGAVSMLIRYSILTIGFYLAILAAGVDLDKFTLIAGAVGVGIGFGLQNIFNNLVSGIILAFERPIQVGDIVEVGLLIGTVLEIGFRSSRVRTFDGAEVIVPNGDLVSNQVVNWTLSDRHRRIRLKVGTAYGTDPEKVIEILMKAVREHPDVLVYPKPMVIFKGFGESSLDFEGLFWTSNFENWMEVNSDVAVSMNKMLKQEGIEIPFPQRDLHLRSVDSNLDKTILVSSTSEAETPGQQKKADRQDTHMKVGKEKLAEPPSIKGAPEKGPEEGENNDG